MRVPPDFGSGLDKPYVGLSGASMRGATRKAGLTIRGKHVIVESSGLSDGVHGVDEGVDEVLVGPLSRSFRRRGATDALASVVVVDGQTSNTVTIACN